MALTTPPIFGLFINKFANTSDYNSTPYSRILGDSGKQTSLLSFCYSNGINYIGLETMRYYNNTSNYDQFSAGTNTLLLSFINNAKINYGIKEVSMHRNVHQIEDTKQSDGTSPVRQMIDYHGSPGVGTSAMFTHIGIDTLYWNFPASPPATSSGNGWTYYELTGSSINVSSASTIVYINPATFNFTATTESATGTTHATPNAMIIYYGEIRQIKSVDSQTQITVDRPFSGISSGAQFHILPSTGTSESIDFDTYKYRVKAISALARLNNIKVEATIDSSLTGTTDIINIKSLRPYVDRFLIRNFTESNHAMYSEIYPIVNSLGEPLNGSVSILLGATMLSGHSGINFLQDLVTGSTIVINNREKYIISSIESSTGLTLTTPATSPWPPVSVNILTNILPYSSLESRSFYDGCDYPYTCTGLTVDYKNRAGYFYMGLEPVSGLTSLYPKKTISDLYEYSVKYNSALLPPQTGTPPYFLPSGGYTSRVDYNGMMFRNQEILRQLSGSTNSSNYSGIYNYYPAPDNPENIAMYINSWGSSEYNDLNSPVFAMATAHCINNLLLYSINSLEGASAGVNSKFTSSKGGDIRDWIEKAKTEAGVCNITFVRNLWNPEYSGTQDTYYVVNYNIDTGTTQDTRVDRIILESEYWNWESEAYSYAATGTITVNGTTITVGGGPATWGAAINASGIKTFKKGLFIQVGSEIRQIVTGTDATSTATIDRPFPTNFTSAWTFRYYDTIIRSSVDFETFLHRVKILKNICYQNNIGLDAYLGRRTTPDQWRKLAPFLDIFYIEHYVTDAAVPYTQYSRSSSQDSVQKALSALTEYRTGTVRILSGNNLEGLGTTFTADMIRGTKIVVGGQIFTIANVTSNNAATTIENVVTPISTYTKYSILIEFAPISYVKSTYHGPFMGGRSYTDAYRYFALSGYSSSGTVAATQVGLSNAKSYNADRTGSNVTGSTHLVGFAIFDYTNHQLLTGINDCGAGGAGTTRESIECVTVPPSQTFELVFNSSTNATCGNNGTISLGRTGGLDPITYTITNTTTGQIITQVQNGLFTGLAPGSWSISAIDGFGDSDTVSPVTITGSFNSTASTISATCGISNDGTINMYASGGSGSFAYRIDTAPYTNFTLSNGAGIYSASTLSSSGSYSAWIRDNANPSCPSVTNVTVSAPTPITYSYTKLDSPCSPTGGTITFINASGGSGLFEYTINSGTTWSSNNVFSSLPLGTYELRVRDSGNTSCISVTQYQVSISQVQILSTTIIKTGSIPVCLTNPSSEVFLSALPINGSGSYTYQWSYDTYTSTGQTISIGPPPFNGNPTLLVTLTTIDTIRSCTATTQTEISGGTLNYPLSTSQSGELRCDGLGNVTLEAVLPTPYDNIIWSNGSTGTTSVVTSPGNYYYTVYYNSCTQDSTPYNLSLSTYIDPVLSASSYTLSPGVQNTINVSGYSTTLHGVASSSVIGWYKNGVGPFAFGSTVNVVETILGNYSYYVKYTTTNGCLKQSAPIIVSITSFNIVIDTSNTSCSGCTDCVVYAFFVDGCTNETYDVNVYDSNSNIINTQTSITNAFYSYSGLSAGTYYMQVTGSCGNVVTQEFFIYDVVDDPCLELSTPDNPLVFCDGKCVPLILVPKCGKVDGDKILLGINEMAGVFLTGDTNNECFYQVEFDYLFNFDCENILGCVSGSDSRSILDFFDGLSLFATVEVIADDGSISTEQTTKIWEFNVNDESTGIYYSGNSQYCEMVEYSILNELKEKCTGYTENTFAAIWRHGKFPISNALIGNNIKIGLLLKGFNCNYNILLDKLRIDRICTVETEEIISIKSCPGFELDRYVDNKKSWVNNDEAINRYWNNLNYRETNYDSTESKLDINTKEIELELDLSRAIEYDIYCYASLSANTCYLTVPPYSAFTNTLIPVSAKTFNQFVTEIENTLIDVKNRQTIPDYPLLRYLFDKYLNLCGLGCSSSNGYNYDTLYPIAGLVGDYWINIIEQMIPATAIWDGASVTYRNTMFDVNKYQYKRHSLLFCDDYECFEDTVAGYCRLSMTQTDWRNMNSDILGNFGPDQIYSATALLATNNPMLTGITFCDRCKIYDPITSSTDISDAKECFYSASTSLLFIKNSGGTLPLSAVTTGLTITTNRIPPIGGPFYAENHSVYGKSRKGVEDMVKLGMSGLGYTIFSSDTQNVMWSRPTTSTTCNDVVDIYSKVDITYRCKSATTNTYAPTVWISTPNGVSFMTGDTNWNILSGVTNISASTDFTSIAVDKDGNKWIGMSGNNYVYRYVGTGNSGRLDKFQLFCLADQGTATTYYKTTILRPDTNGDVWIGSENCGLYKLTVSNQSNIKLENWRYVTSYGYASVIVTYNPINKTYGYGTINKLYWPGLSIQGGDSTVLRTITDLWIDDTTNDALFTAHAGATVESGFDSSLVTSKYIGNINTSRSLDETFIYRDHSQANQSRSMDYVMVTYQQTIGDYSTVAYPDNLISKRVFINDPESLQLNPSTVPDAYVYSVSMDKTRNMWFGTLIGAPDTYNGNISVMIGNIFTNLNAPTITNYPRLDTGIIPNINGKPFVIQYRNSDTVSGSTNLNSVIDSWIGHSTDMSANTPSNNIFDISVDSTNVRWFGTTKGLATFNGPPIPFQKQKDEQQARIDALGVGTPWAFNNPPTLPSNYESRFFTYTTANTQTSGFCTTINPNIVATTLVLNGITTYLINVPSFDVVKIVYENGSEITLTSSDWTALDTVNGIRFVFLGMIKYFKTGIPIGTKFVFLDITYCMDNHTAMTSNIVTKIEIRNDDDVWFGSRITGGTSNSHNYGVYRYDGTIFRRYGTDNGHPNVQSNQIYDIAFEYHIPTTSTVDIFYSGSITKRVKTLKSIKMVISGATIVCANCNGDSINDTEIIIRNLDIDSIDLHTCVDGIPDTICNTVYGREIGDESIFDGIVTITDMDITDTDDGLVVHHDGGSQA